MKSKKESFFISLCSDIEDGREINWNKFKKLKGSYKKSSNLDAFDFINFCKFFKELYSNKSLTVSRIAALRADMPRTTLMVELTNILDNDITFEELKECVFNSKKGKAVAEDLISNEFLKTSSSKMLKTVLYLFNQCLSHGVYPWRTSLVTPLHKKGDIYNPNNYRAIAVASNLGKLFSSILLQRLISFRQMTNPDTPNQLGFCKNAQTADHVLTLTTIVNKYVKKQKTKVYACFVDYAKAFDSVCREALLHKLWTMGIQGRFFICVEDMYSGSIAKIKLLNKLSEKIEILCGTEQGHPMSPELFKCFIHHLSVELNNISGLSTPTLNSVQVTHLLWADDLVLLGLDPKSLQAMLDTLSSYCIDWGLTVDTEKTAIMVFNRSGRLLKESLLFKLGETKIPSTREYCYLGVTFILIGALKVAQEKLRQKGLRSYFSLKRMLDMRGLRKAVLFRLFDALIGPVVSYGSQVWMPSTHAFDQIILALHEPNQSTAATHSYLPKIATDPIEKKRRHPSCLQHLFT